MKTIRNTGDTITPVREMHWTRQRTLAALQAWATHHGRSPMCKDWRHSDPEHNRPTSDLVQARFGTWNKALTAAGLPINRSGPNRDTREEFFTLAFRIPMELHEGIEKIAARNGETMVAVIRRALRHEIDRESA